MSKVIKQHFVPQSYLRRFSSDGKSLFVFDRTTQNIFKTNVLNVAQERYFYDLPEDIVNLGGDVQAAESVFSRIAEPDFATLMQHLLPTIETYSLTAEQRSRFSFHVVFQLLRTRVFRDTLIDMQENFIQALVNDFLQRNFPDAPLHLYPIYKISDSAATIKHFQLIFDGKTIPELMRMLRTFIWLIGVNQSQQPLYTSDNPVVQQFHGTHLSDNGMGLLGLGSEIIFPLTPEFALIIRERVHFRIWDQLDNRQILLNHADVDRLNKLQLLQCSRQIYSQADNFDFARKICIEYPELSSKGLSSRCEVQSKQSSKEENKTIITVTRRVRDR